MSFRPPFRQSRRRFLWTLVAGLTSAPWMTRLSAADAAPVPPPHATRVPHTPFDAPPGTWTLVVLPDTQNLAQDFPAAFVRQTKWIVAHRRRHDIRFVVHEGDITNHNVPAEWENARDALRVLRRGRVPFALLPGNHDLGPEGRATDRTTLLNDYFSPRDYRHSAAVGYFEAGRMENTWHELSTPTGRFLIVMLEFGPRHAVLDWAGAVIAARPQHRVIVVTHAYLYSDSTRYDWAARGSSQRWNPHSYPLASAGSGAVSDGEEMWQRLVRPHPNVRLVLNGHVLNDGTGHLASERPHGPRVHQVLANYQSGVEPRRPYGGGAYLRLMQFLPDGKTVRVRSYSPWLDDWLVTPDQQFEFGL